MGDAMRLSLLFVVVLLVAAFAATPALAQSGSGLVVVGQHAIQFVKTSADQDASVVETVHFFNAGDSAFSGVLDLDLDPDANIIALYFADAQGTPLGDAGQPSSGPLENEPAGAHTRYHLHLADHGVTFEPDATYRLILIYTLPADDRDFSRGFTLDTERMSAELSTSPGLLPRAPGLQFNALGNAWKFLLAAPDSGPFAAGEAFAFTLEETDVPLTPLSVAITASVVDDRITLRATPTGGIGPYTYSWDLDGDGDCDDAQGATTRIELTDARLHDVAACVTDAASPAPVRQPYQALVHGGVTRDVGPSGWMLGLLGLALGALLVFGLVAGGLVRMGRGGATTTTAAGPSLGAESKDMLELRQRVMIASLKELELGKKKGEIDEGLYTPLKAELKQDTVRIMREIERRKGETV